MDQGTYRNADRGDQDAGRDALRALLTGVDARRYRLALALLCEGGWWTRADLVRVTATSRRGVEALLREIAVEHAGDRFRLTGAEARACRELLGEDPLAAPAAEAPRVPGPAPDATGPGLPVGGLPADPVGHLLSRHADLLARMEGLVAGAPRAVQALDHVAATPETVVRRALLLDARFWLPGARLLCVGDHDLTSLAVALLRPDVEVTVVDIDERILGYIGEQAERLGLDVRTRWADLRLGLPPSVHGYADLAVTDPPYTPEGIGLFVARACEGLRDVEQGRILLAYGASERTPMLALKVQSTLHDLNLAYEAMYPDFNRYFGAEAIGSAADMYVLRPTTKTLPAVAARTERFASAIYTHGPQSVESQAAASGADAAALAEFAPGLLVGEWPRDLLPRTPRAKLATWLAKPYAAATERVAIAVPAGLEAALPRLLLAARGPHVRAYLGAPPDDLSALSEPLAPVYAVRARGNVVDATRRPLPEEVPARQASAAVVEEERVEIILRRILDHAHGKLANTWREALTKLPGGPTKKQARSIVAAVAPWSADVTPLELPAHRLRELRAAVAASLAQAEPS
ncbi:bis-aminopropyl spermidine synthase family protein [Microtetraspora malaysiensis]|uniref:bis-aminopropyl spermidine synthase family protein n=1 Tax=Microtetraspora malaysiensis TaxID=161358 RepID=UPI000A02709D|nr:bis-aminopropyl spermidine synthase family protein [Microtetraspora malaysiensis]